MSTQWYAAKTLYRTVATGEASSAPYPTDPALSSVEERVVLLQATSFDDAIAQGEAEARAYTTPPFRNGGGQALVIEYLDTIDVFLIDETPGHNVEVYSLNYRAPRETDNDVLIDNHFGGRNQDDSMREQFVPAGPDATDC